MTYIKKLVMKGFKSFARETVLHFDRHTVVVVGPNGSGKSNITDALCFVLGRLSIKSIRAAKASHLIFSGNKDFKPANHAYVEITWDNEDELLRIIEILKEIGNDIRSTPDPRSSYEDTNFYIFMRQPNYNRIKNPK